LIINYDYLETVFTAQDSERLNSLPAADTDFTNLISFRASMQNINLRTFTRF